MALQKDFSYDVMAVKNIKYYYGVENDIQEAEIFFHPFNFDFRSDSKGSFLLQFLYIFNLKSNCWREREISTWRCFLTLKGNNCWIFPLK